jgi:hypothetical protein
VDGGDICDTAALKEGKEDVPQSLHPDAGSINRGAGAFGEVERRRRGGSKEEATPTRCTTQCNIPFRITWRNVIKATRDKHHMAWSAMTPLRAAPQEHRSRHHAGLRPWRKPVRTSLLLSSRVLVMGRVFSQAEAGQQAQLRRWTGADLP